MAKFLSIWDWLLLPFYLMVIYYLARSIKRKHINKYPEYKYFVKGLFAKIFGGIGVVLIYLFYYQYGDTLYYFIGTKAMVDLSFKDFSTYVDLMFNNRSMENYYVFDDNTWRPYMYMYDDTKAFSVIRFASIFGFLGFKKFVLIVVLLATYSYIGIWKLFKLFLRYFPGQERNFAISILFMPSVVFWGSGLLKDTFTISSAAWFIYAFFNILTKEKKVYQNLLVIALNTYILTSLKPYIFFVIVFGVMVVLTYRFGTKIKSSFLKVIVLPLIIVAIWLGGSFAMLKVGQSVGGAYVSIDKLIETAILTKDDLTRDYYGGNHFDIGKIEPSISGILLKAPKAINAGLFRPHLWESSNIVMMFSGLENLIVLLLVLYTLFITVFSWSKYGFTYMFRSLFDNELILFSIMFSIAFAFMVGLTTANFGALVRYKIPLTPFFISTLYIMIFRYNRYDFDSGKFDYSQKFKDKSK